MLMKKLRLDGRSLFCWSRLFREFGSFVDVIIVIVFFENEAVIFEILIIVVSDAVAEIIGAICCALTTEIVVAV